MTVTSKDLFNKCYGRYAIPAVNVFTMEQDVLPGMGNPKNCALKNRNYIKTLGL